MCSTARVSAVRARAYTIPTDAPESDGTLAWTSTTLVVCEVDAGGCTGIGYTYADTATATLVRDLLAELVCGEDALCIPRAWLRMVHGIRNLGRPGIASMAISSRVALVGSTVIPLDTASCEICWARTASRSVSPPPAWVVRDTWIIAG